MAIKSSITLEKALLKHATVGESSNVVISEIEVLIKSQDPKIQEVLNTLPKENLKMVEYLFTTLVCKELIRTGSIAETALPQKYRISSRVEVLEIPVGWTSYQFSSTTALRWYIHQDTTLASVLDSRTPINPTGPLINSIMDAVNSTNKLENE